MPDFASFLGVMIGLGVGIDYALFIVTRFRENLHHGHTVGGGDLDRHRHRRPGGRLRRHHRRHLVPRHARHGRGLHPGPGRGRRRRRGHDRARLAHPAARPARASPASRVEVTRWRGLIAAGLVAVALRRRLGLGSSPSWRASRWPAVVIVARVRPRSAQAARCRAAPPKPLRADDRLSLEPGRSSTTRGPRPCVGAAVLLVLAIPVLGLRLGFSDEGNYAKDTTTRQAYDLLADGFGPGFNGPLPARRRGAAGRPTRRRWPASPRPSAADPGVAFVSPPIPNDPVHPPPTVAVDPRPLAAGRGHHRARAPAARRRASPAAEAALGVEVAVTGHVPSTSTSPSYLGARMPYFFAAVLALSFLLLMAVFRSILVPLKAVVMNLLSIGAAYGVVVAVSSGAGWATSRAWHPARSRPFVPMMMFAIVFGLSMDYEVFLLSRVKEEWDRTGDSHLSVANGLAATARVITAAAAIMVVVFGSFLLETDRTSSSSAWVWPMAVLLDATVVRMLLVPATMELLGDRNWWLPRWLDRILPNIDVEGTPDRLDDDDDVLDEPDRGLVTV